MYIHTHTLMLSVMRGPWLYKWLTWQAHFHMLTWNTRDHETLPVQEELSSLKEKLSEIRPHVCVAEDRAKVEAKLLELVRRKTSPTYIRSCLPVQHLRS